MLPRATGILTQLGKVSQLNSKVYPKLTQLNPKVYPKLSQLNIKVYPNSLQSSLRLTPSSKLYQLSKQTYVSATVGNVVTVELAFDDANKVKVTQS